MSVFMSLKKGCVKAGRSIDRKYALFSWTVLVDYLVKLGKTSNGSCYANGLYDLHKFVNMTIILKISYG